MSNTDIKLPFGLDSNEVLVHISEVVSGAACCCFCPACKAPLIAHKGSKNQHHFKHASLTDCDGGIESVIHRAAKQIIREKKKLMLPEFKATVTLIDSRGHEQKEEAVVVNDRTCVQFERVEEEVSLNDIRADLLATVFNKPLIIEVFYRHSVDEIKLSRIEKSKISAVEIDLSDITPDDVRDWETFWVRINDTKRIKWLHNAKSTELVLKIKSRLELKIEQLEASYRVQDQKKVARVLRERLELSDALVDLKRISSAEHIAKLRSEAGQHSLINTEKDLLAFSLDDLPYYLDVNVPDGDWIYGCDRRIWQNAFYSQVILKCRNPKNSLTIRWGDSWLQSEGLCVVPKAAQIVGMFGRRYPDLVAPHLKELPSSWRTLKAYCNYLEEIGVLYFTGNETRHQGSSWFQIVAKVPSSFPYQADSRHNDYYCGAAGTTQMSPHLIAFKS